MSLPSSPAQSAQFRIVSHVLQTMSALGVSPAEALEAVGLQPDHLRPEATLPAPLLIDMTEWLAWRTGRADFGLRFAELVGGSVLGPLTLLIEHCATLGELYQILRRYLPLYHTGVRYSLMPYERNTLLRLHVDTDGEYPPRHYAELALAICLFGCRLILGPDWRPEAVLFSHARLGRDTDYAQVLRASVRFNAPVQGILISAEDMARRTRAGGSQVKLLLESYFQDLRQSQSRDKASRVSELLRALLPTGDHSLERIADILALHPQTLQRRLRAQGTSYCRILAETRLTLARGYLETPDLPATEIAALLGFSEASALSRFMRQHAGAAPRALRRDMKAAG